MDVRNPESNSNNSHEMHSSNWSNQFYSFLFLYMTLAVNEMNGCGLNIMQYCAECLLKNKDDAVLAIKFTEGGVLTETRQSVFVIKMSGCSFIKFIASTKTLKGRKKKINTE